MSQAGIESLRPELVARGARQGMNEHSLRQRVLAVAVASPLAAEAAGAPDLDPVGGPVDGAVEARGIDEGLHQQQRMAEAHRPVPDQAARAQRQHPRPEVARSARQEQEPGIVGDKVQPVKLDAVVPADPAVPCAALQRRRREHRQRQPLAAMMGHIAQRLADPRQRTQIVVRLHQGPKPPLVFRRYKADRHLRKNHQRSHPPTSVLLHLYQSPRRMSSPARISLSALKKP